MRSKRWLARSKARFAALQALYQFEQLTEESALGEICLEFKLNRFDQPQYNPVDIPFFESLLDAFQEHKVEIDTYISSHLEDSWRIERLASTLRALLRLLVIEIQYQKTPMNLIRAEYQELANAFVGEPETRFAWHFIGELTTDQNRHQEKTNA